METPSYICIYNSKIKHNKHIKVNILRVKFPYTNMTEHVLPVQGCFFTTSAEVFLQVRPVKSDGMRL